MVLNRLSQKAINVIGAFKQSKKRVLASDFFSKIAQEKGIGSFFSPELKNVDKLKTVVSINSVVEGAFVEAYELKHTYVGTEHLFLALLKLIKAKEYKDVQKKILTFGTYPKFTKRTTSLQRKTPILDAFGVNLTQLYEGGLLGNLVNRPEEVNNLSEILLQKDKQCPLIVGDVGVGRSSLVKLLAQKISDLEVSYALSNIQIIDFDMSAFISNVIGREGIEVGFSALSEEVFSAGNVILYVKDIHSLFLPLGYGNMPPLASGFFKSAFLYSGITVIASTSTTHFQRYLLDDETVNSFFTVMKVKEPNKSTTMSILRKKSTELEKFHQVKITDEFLEKVYTFSANNLKGKFFPQKALELLDKASAIALNKKSVVPEKYSFLRREKRLLKTKFAEFLQTRNLTKASAIDAKIKAIESKLATYKVLVESTVLNDTFLDLALSKETNTPLSEIRKTNNDFSDLEGKLGKKIFGQKKAVNALSTAFVRASLGLSTRKGPMGNFLFLGPTGVGKTELARVLSSEVFGAGSLIKLDMSDFSEKHTVSRLVGAPPGYIGYNEGGELTEKISKTPRSVVLFDEIEKAHPDVLNILLQIMDDGNLVDGKGRSFDFSHSVVILTSNLGSELIYRDNLGFKFNTPEIKEGEEKKNTFEDRLLENLKNILRPELLNRLDEIIVFNKLSKATIEGILGKYISELSVNLERRGLKLSVGKDALDFLCEKGYSEEYGARALRRVVDKLLVDEVAKIIMKGTRKGNEIVVSVKDGKLVVSFPCRRESN